MSTTSDSYKNWTISLTAESNMCANYSFDVTDPTGRSSHVAMGGDSELRALERAKEFIDLEMALAGGE